MLKRILVLVLALVLLAQPTIAMRPEGLTRVKDAAEVQDALKLLTKSSQWGHAREWLAKRKLQPNLDSVKVETGEADGTKVVGLNIELKKSASEIDRLYAFLVDGEWTMTLVTYTKLGDQSIEVSVTDIATEKSKQTKIDLDKPAEAYANETSGCSLPQTSISGDVQPTGFGCNLVTTVVTLVACAWTCEDIRDYGALCGIMCSLMSMMFSYIYCSLDPYSAH